MTGLRSQSQCRISAFSCLNLALTFWGKNAQKVKVKRGREAGLVTLLFYHEPKPLSRVKQPQFSSVPTSMLSFLCCQSSSAPQQHDARLPLTRSALVNGSHRLRR